jgi:hypothetical protein
MASSIWARSWRNSASMLVIFIRVRISQGRSLGPLDLDVRSCEWQEVAGF